MANYSFNIEPVVLGDKNLAKSNILAYLIASNAPTNVEVRNQEETFLVSSKNDNGTNKSLVRKNQERLYDIAKFLVDNKTKVEVVILIHGYNTSEKDFEDWVSEVYEYITEDEYINKKTFLFLGYRWPSEHIAAVANDKDGTIGSNLRTALTTLPVFFQTLLRYSIVGIIAASIFVMLLAIVSAFASNAFEFSSFISFLFTLGIGFFACLLGLVVCVIIQRATNYFRDNYRAVNYGVPDLVEFIRQVDYTINKIDSNFINDDTCRIKLSFIAHSMGAFVTTNTIRILSDVFDDKSILDLDKHANTDVSPSQNIGRVFSLGRLVLASPDIPIESIMPERSNFLRSSLRRFEESYLFSNQGDVVLRVASTAANYMSFPANTYERGFRLGNIVVNSTEKLGNILYGIVNQDSSSGKIEGAITFDSSNSDSTKNSLISKKAVKKINLNNSELDNDSAMRQVGIVSEKVQTLSDLLFASLQSTTGKNQLKVEQNLKVPQGTSEETTTPSTVESIADFFTYFDCTDYIDFNHVVKEKEVKAKNENTKPKGILTKALRKKELSFMDCFWLIIDSSLRGSNNIDVHGGYFSGKFSRKMIYRIAFMGFQEFIKSLEGELDTSKIQIDTETINGLIQSYNLELSNNEKKNVTKLIKLSMLFSQECKEKQIKVFLAPQRYLDMLRGEKRKVNEICSN